MPHYCLMCAVNITPNLAFKDKDGSYYHFRIIQQGKPEVTKCGPVDFFEENVAENRKEEMDESEVEG